MDNNDVKVLVDAFRSYRDMLEPIQSNLSDFIETYDMMRSDIDRLNTSFGGDVKGNLEKIYSNLSEQAAKAEDLSSRIEQFIKVTTKYTEGVTRLVSTFDSVESRLASVNDLEKKAEEQIGKLDAILEEKRKSYNIKELERTLEGYNNNVQKVSEFINKDVAESLSAGYSKLESIKSGIDTVMKRQDGGNSNVEKLIVTYTETNDLLRKITEGKDVNEAYIFDILDRWAEDRKVKTKKK